MYYFHGYFFLTPVCFIAKYSKSYFISNNFLSWKKKKNSKWTKL